MNALPAQSSQEHLKAVCYKCSYVGRADGSCCPECSFPLIFEPEKTPAGGTRLEDIFARTSVHIGAPPLPGVDAEPRKAQLLAEARKRRATRRATTPSPAAQAKKSRRHALKVALVCLSAVAAGVAAAVVHSGGF